MCLRQEDHPTVYYC